MELLKRGNMSRGQNRDALFYHTLFASQTGRENLTPASPKAVKMKREVIFVSSLPFKQNNNNKSSLCRLKELYYNQPAGSLEQTLSTFHGLV